MCVMVSISKALDTQNVKLRQESHPLGCQNVVAEQGARGRKQLWGKIMRGQSRIVPYNNKNNFSICSLFCKLRLPRFLDHATARSVL